MLRRTGTEDEIVSEEELRRRRLRAGAAILDIALLFMVLIGAPTTVVSFLIAEYLQAGIVGSITVVFVLLAVPGMVARRRELNKGNEQK